MRLMVPRYVKTYVKRNKNDKAAAESTRKLTWPGGLVDYFPYHFPSRDLNN